MCCCYGFREEKMEIDYKMSKNRFVIIVTEFRLGFKIDP